MASRTSEKCWVCGQAAAMRCSACGEAGLDILFCSREHQKLLWPLHRRVCGVNRAKPFVWPALSKEEAAFGLKLLNKVGIAPSKKKDSWRKQLEAELGTDLEVWEIKKIVEALQHEDPDCEILEDEDIDPHAGYSAFRAANYHFEVNLEGIYSLPWADRAYSEAMPIVDKFFPRPTPGDGVPPSAAQKAAWFPSLMHRFICTVGLRQMMIDITDTTPNVDSLLNHLRASHTALEELVEKEVKRTHPQVAARFVQYLQLTSPNRIW
ncbi:hypothetical protein JCM6882_000768 [Rhodosporidiobolus microsporus]